MEYNYQTLEQFVKNPFEMGYQPSLQEYAKKYEDLNKRQMIKFGGALILDDLYFCVSVLHLNQPEEFGMMSSFNSLLMTS